MFQMRLFCSSIQVVLCISSRMTVQNLLLSLLWQLCTCVLHIRASDEIRVYFATFVSTAQGRTGRGNHKQRSGHVACAGSMQPCCVSVKLKVRHKGPPFHSKDELYIGDTEIPYLLFYQVLSKSNHPTPANIMFTLHYRNQIPWLISMSYDHHVRLRLPLIFKMFVKCSDKCILSSTSTSGMALHLYIRHC